MKITLKTLSLLSGAAFFTLTSLSAVATDPVGYTSYPITDGSDIKIGVPLVRAATFQGAPSSVVNGVVTFTGTLPDLQTEAHYLLVEAEGAALEGMWYVVQSSDSNSVTVSEDLATLGLVSGIAVSLVPFWTLDSLLPSGGELPQSSDVFAPSAQLLLNDLTAIGINLSTGSAYLYHDGAQGAAGWYDVSDPNAGLKGDVVITLETFITIRNQSGGDAKIVFAGSVPVDVLGTTVLSRSLGPQDSLISNPYPTDLTLANSELFEDGVISASSDVFAPVDQLLVFETTSSGINPTPTKAYLYHDGAQGAAGWYDVSNPNAGLKNADPIPAGSALIVRKPAGSDEVISWTPPIPYSL